MRVDEPCVLFSNSIDSIHLPQNLTGKPAECASRLTRLPRALLAVNPPTNGHIQLATEIAHSGLVDQVWLNPCGPRPDKPNMKTSPTQRYTMCEIAVNTMVSASFREPRNCPLSEYIQCLSYAGVLPVTACLLFFVFGSMMPFPISTKGDRPRDPPASAYGDV